MVEMIFLKFVIVWGGLLITAWPVNNFVENLVLKLPPKSLLRASDTVVHGLIGGFSFWLTCHLCPDLVLDVSCLFSSLGDGCGRKNKRSEFSYAPLASMFNFAVAFMISCIVDLDHVFQDFIQMINGGVRVPWERGVLHLSLPPLILTLILYISAAIFHYIWCLKFGTLIIVCIFSHHVRDGIHHGLWLHPLGITPKLPQWLYIFITQFLPLVTSGVVSILLYRIKSKLILTNEIYIV